jgi:hypothetical protein
VRKQITPMTVLMALFTAALFLAKVKYGFFGGK